MLTSHWRVEKELFITYSTCVPDICMYFTFVSLPQVCVASSDATWVSRGSKGHSKCIQHIHWHTEYYIPHAGHACLTYACILLWYLPSKSALHPVMHCGFLGGLQVTYNTYNILPNIQNTIYQIQITCTQHMHVFCCNLFPPSPRCVQRCIAGF